MSSIRVFVLGSLAERGPMHGHQLRLLAEREHVSMWTDFHVGAIYGALKRLTAEGLIEPVRTEREGGRPERQVLAITDAGRKALGVQRLAALTEFSMRPDPFDLAMARLGPEVLSDLPGILAARRSEIAAEAASAAARIEHIDQYLTLAERHVMRHRGYRLQAELDWLDSLLADLPAVISDESTREAD